MSKFSLRDFTTDNPITRCFRSTIAPLVKIDIDRNITYYQTKAQKRDALREAQPTDKFIMPWGGEWSTDVFNVSQSDIDEMLVNF
jgi:hypothetical protein